MGKWNEQGKSTGLLQRQPWVVTPKGERECLLATLERLSGERLSERRELDR